MHPDKRITPRSIALAALSICGTLAAAAWLVVATPAEAGDAPTKKAAAKTVVTTVNTEKSSEVEPVPVKKAPDKAVQKKKPRVDFGRFEDY
jgi:hypothetical protein